MERWRGRVAVVTGASSGIGLAIAKTLVKEGMIVVGLARRKAKMEEEMADVGGPGKFFARECDVSDEQSVIEAFKYVEETFKSLSVLVNNAGIMLLKRIEDAEMKELEDVVRCNFIGLLYCCKYGLKLLKANKDEAHVINMNSVAGLKVPHPRLFGDHTVHTNVYSATKFAITSLSEIFSNELLGNKIRVTNLSPGIVMSEITDPSVFEKLGLCGKCLSPGDVADSIKYILGAPTHVQVTQLTLKSLGEVF